jgi:hypothetical protein
MLPAHHKEALECNVTRKSLPANLSPNLDDTGPIVRRLMGLPVMAASDTAWDRTRVCSDASITAMQGLRPLRHSGGQVRHVKYYF